jgi:hypothetical protein
LAVVNLSLKSCTLLAAGMSIPLSS